MPNILVVGAGIIGTAIARELAIRHAGEITIVEKESAVGKHASGRNSGVIHSGINQKPGTLKAKMCVKGSQLLRQYCRERKVPMVECGTLVIARNQREKATLEHLLVLGEECGVPNLRLISREELEDREPLARGILALFSPTGAIVDAVALLENLADDARNMGVQFRFNTEVSGLAQGGAITNSGQLQADYVINCAGLHADHLAHSVGIGKEYRIIPFRGEYMEVTNCDIRSMVYQVPDLRFPFLSVHLTRETDGRVLAGPTATLAFGREAYDKQWVWCEMAEMFSSRQFLRLMTHPEFIGLCMKNGLISFFRRSFYREIRSLIKEIHYSQLKPYRSGIRAQIVDSSGVLINDVLIQHTSSSTHILNAISPGMTCSLAFAEYVVALVLQRMSDDSNDR